MFTRQLLAMLVMLLSFVIGIILVVQDNWKTGLTVGVVIVALGFVLAIVNMIKAFRGFDRNF